MLTRFHPHRDLFRDFDRLFERTAPTLVRPRFAPAVDVEESDTAFVLTADLPGVAESDIDVTVHDGVLTLSGKRETSTEKETDGVLYRERNSGSFVRRFRLGPKVDAGAIEAGYEAGVLKVTLPKVEEPKPRQIEVKSA